MKNKISFKLQHGKVDGVYIKAIAPNAPLVIITNGHNGFYNYGMFPYIQETLALKGISSYSYNFSHGGVKEDSDYFSELDMYEKNSMRLETEDLYGVVKHLKQSEIEFSEKNALFLLTHSLGGVPTIFAAKKLLSEGYRISGIILISSIKTLDVWPKSMIEEWEKNGVSYLKNNRTKQDLPQGKEFYQEIKQAHDKWSIHKTLEKVETNFLIIYGEKDEAVPPEHSITLNEWNKQYKHKSDIVAIANATHTFNTKHPFEDASPELNLMIDSISKWINKVRQLL